MIGGLGDEYIDTALLVGRSYDSSNGDLAYPNLHRRGYLDTSSRQALKETAKWSHFLSLANSDPLIGAYEGGHYQQYGVFRPSRFCHMSDHRTMKRFCPVCHEEFYKAILKRCGEQFRDSAYHAEFPLSRWR